MIRWPVTPALLSAGMLCWIPWEGVADPRVATLEVRYVQNSGFIVATDQQVLVFDYVRSIPGIEGLPNEVTPWTGRRDDDRPVVVFVTHSHSDHFSPEIFEWAKTHRRIQYVLGFPGATPMQNAHVMSPHESLDVQGLRVRTSGSTDAGVGFLVTIAGVTLFHAGDLALWDEASREAFAAEIAWVKSQGLPVDLAFLPIATGATCEPLPAIWEGVRLATRELGPKVLLPMHVRCVDRLPSVYERFRAEMTVRFPGLEIAAPRRRGDSFRFCDGVLTRVPAAD